MCVRACMLVVTVEELKFELGDGQRIYSLAFENRSEKSRWFKALQRLLKDLPHAPARKQAFEHLKVSEEEQKAEALQRKKRVRRSISAKAMRHQMLGSMSNPGSSSAALILDSASPTAAASSPSPSPSQSQSPSPSPSTSVSHSPSSSPSPSPSTFARHAHGSSSMTELSPLSASLPITPSPLSSSVRHTSPPPSVSTSSVGSSAPAASASMSDVTAAASTPDEHSSRIKKISKDGSNSSSSPQLAALPRKATASSVPPPSTPAIPTSQSNDGLRSKKRRSTFFGSKPRISEASRVEQLTAELEHERLMRSRAEETISGLETDLQALSDTKRMLQLEILEGRAGIESKVGALEETIRELRATVASLTLANETLRAQLAMCPQHSAVDISE